MINELYQLSVAMKQAGISATNWHRKYKLIPNVNDKAPCCKLTVDAGKLIGIDSLSTEQAALLRKYGTNQGTFPCMNLVPLFRITDEKVKKTLSTLQAEQIDENMLQQISGWCNENNWTPKFRKKFRISMEAVPDELRQLLNVHPFEPLATLLHETMPLSDPDFLHQEMYRISFDMLKEKVNIRLALLILFHLGNAEKEPENDVGTLSVALESSELLRKGIPAVSNRFVNECNQFLLAADKEESATAKLSATDAFGNAFAPLEEPMPTVKLAGGFEVTLRTMFKEQHCQHRYGAIENASYPIAPSLRLELQAALSWLGGSAHKNIYWANTDKDEILFAYPHTLPQSSVSFMSPFKKNGETTFQAAAKQFLASTISLDKNTASSLSEHIQLFILRKITKGQTKVVYTRVTSPMELKERSEHWITGCYDNLPSFSFKQFLVPYPLEVSDILNRAWKQDGTIATERFKPVPKYRGMQLFLDSDIPIHQDLHMLVHSCTNIAPYLGSNRGNDLSAILWKVKQQIALLGFLLYRMGIRKEQYMNSFPYLYGQLLKAADELHVQYCKVVRMGDMPSQLVGSSLYQAAVEAPVRTLMLLQQRMAPYYVWAKTYRMKNQPDSGLVGWLYSIIEKTANQLAETEALSPRLSDEEKAQMFLGYLGSLPKSRKEEATQLETAEEEL